MQPILVHKPNTRNIEAALARACHQSSAGDITYGLIHAATTEAEHLLELRGLPTDFRIGARYELPLSAGTRNSDHTHRVRTENHVILERRRMGWHMVEVRRVIKQQPSGSGALWLGFDHAAHIKKQVNKSVMSR